jgi:hypothetical protein
MCPPLLDGKGANAMQAVKHHTELPGVIRTAEHGSKILVTTSTLKELGERAAARMGRGDLRFMVSSKDVQQIPATENGPSV